MASLVIPSYNRPWNLEKSIPKLVKYKAINEIIILNGHPNHRYKNTQNFQKVKVFDDFTNNDKYYAARRYIGMAEKATNDIVITLDDDELPNEQLISNLVKAVQADPSRMYGHLPRTCNQNGYNTKSGKDNNMILNPMALEKRIVEAYKNTALSKDQKILKQTKGNGEDILFNHFVKQYTGKDPKVVKGKVRFMDSSNGYHDRPSHYSIRTKLCKRLYARKQKKEVLAIDAIEDSYLWSTALYILPFLLLVTIILICILANSSTAATERGVRLFGMMLLLATITYVGHVATQEFIQNRKEKQTGRFDIV